MKHCNDYQIIVSSFVLLNLDWRFKILNRSDKRMLWSLMTASLWFSSLPFSFPPCQSLFSLSAFFLIALYDGHCLSWVKVSFVFGSDIFPTSYLCFLYTPGVQRSGFFFSASISERIFSSRFSTLGRSKIKMDTSVRQMFAAMENQFYIKISFFSSFFPSSFPHLHLSFSLIALHASLPFSFSSHICCGSDTNWPFLNIP